MSLRFTLENEFGTRNLQKFNLGFEIPFFTKTFFKKLQPSIDFSSDFKRKEDLLQEELIRSKRNQRFFVKGRFGEEKLKERESLRQTNERNVEQRAFNSNFHENME